MLRVNYYFRIVEDGQPSPDIIEVWKKYKNVAGNMKKYKNKNEFT